MLETSCEVNQRVGAKTRNTAIRLSCALLLCAGITLGTREASAAFGPVGTCDYPDPPPDQVYVYQNFDYQPPCAALSLGMYPYAGQGTGGFGIPDESMSAIKVGANVRLRVFHDPVYAGGYFVVNGGYQIPALNWPWNDVISSARVESNARSPFCNDLVRGEFALFADINLGGDCVVWQYGQQLDSAEALGIANDSVSSVNPGPNVSCPAYDILTLYADNGESGGFLQMRSGGSPLLDLRNKGFNDATSSLLAYKVCANP